MVAMDTLNCEQNLWIKYTEAILNSKNHISLQKN